MLSALEEAAAAVGDVAKNTAATAATTTRNENKMGRAYNALAGRPLKST